MGTVYAEIELSNANDLEMILRGLMDQDEIKKIRVNMLADSGSYFMAVNENVRDILQLPFLEKKPFRTATDSVIEFDVVGPVQAKLKNRMCICTAVVVPGDAECLLGSIPMEALDVLVHSLRQELIFNPKHPDNVMSR